MSALDPRHAQLAELFGRYVRSTGVERNRLGAELDALAPKVLNLGTLQERLEAKVSPEPNTGCHIFTTSQRDSGHASIRNVDGTLIPAHRAAWRLYRGEIPEGAQVLHTCDNGWCVNPAHLYLGDHAQNMRDKVALGRAIGPKGEAHGKARLTEADVLEIRRARAAGETTVALAARFGVEACTVTHICTNQTWRHI